jgi:hypothetical protein
MTTCQQKFKISQFSAAQEIQALHKMGRELLRLVILAVIFGYLAVQQWKTKHNAHKKKDNDL